MQSDSNSDNQQMSEILRKSSKDQAYRLGDSRKLSIKDYLLNLIDCILRSMLGYFDI